MAATTAAAVAPAEMVGGRKRDQTILIEIKITGANCLRTGVRLLLLAPECGHARLAYTRPIPQFERHLGEQTIRDFGLRAPAWTFIAANIAELAAIRVSAKRTPTWVVLRSRSHLILKFMADLSIGR